MGGKSGATENIIWSSCLSIHTYTAVLLLHDRSSNCMLSWLNIFFSRSAPLDHTASQLGFSLKPWLCLWSVLQDDILEATSNRIPAFMSICSASVFGFKAWVDFMWRTYWHFSLCKCSSTKRCCCYLKGCFQQAPDAPV